MATRYEHAGAAVPTTITAGIDTDDTTITIASASGWPTGAVGPFWVTIAAGTADEEKVLVASRSTTTLTVSSRGADGTTARSHSSGAAIIHSFSATEADDANDLASDITALGGTPVTTSATQTLTAKSVDLGSNTVTMTKAQLNAAVSDADVATLAGTETLTGKTIDLTDNTVTGTFAELDTAITDVDLNAFPRGVLGSATKTTDGSGITSGGGVTDLASLSVEVTPAASRKIRVTAQIHYALSTTAGTVTFYIREGSTNLQKVNVDVAADGDGFITFHVDLTPTAAAHTYKLSMATTAGTARQSGDGSADRVSSITVEDVGAA